MREKGTAGNEMCTFLIVNISSLQLIPVNVIAYRSQYGSVNPAAVIGPAILATAVSTAAAVIFCRIREGSGGKNIVQQRKICYNQNRRKKKSDNRTGCR